MIAPATSYASAASRRRSQGLGERRGVGARDRLVYAVIGVAVLIASALVRDSSLVPLVALVAFGGLGVWMFLSVHYERTLAVLLLYLGLLDGYIKLRSGHSYATLGRDVLLYAICLGIVVRGIVHRRPVPRLVPLTGWIIALVAVALAELANPDAISLPHSLAGLRPHLEFVPLFFLGYLVLRSKRRLRGLLALLLIVGVANGIVGWIQFNMSPAQLASWGPGYSTDIYGTGVLASRLYYDPATGTAEIRPFGLGSDEGQGGAFGLLALPAGIALISLAGARRTPGLAILAGLGICGAVLAVITSQGRSEIIGAVVAVAAYLCLSLSPRRLIPTIAAFAASLLIGALVISTASGAANHSLFTRFATVTPSNLLSTTAQARGGSLSAGPKLAGSLPLGAGLGHVGPASTALGAEVGSYDGETEFNYLIVELGDAGLIVVVGFTLRLLFVSVRTRRIEDQDARLLLAALAAPLFGIAAQYVVSAPTSTSPYAPYLWLAAGALSYWLFPRAGGERAVEGAP
jgi:hypothetical protein